MQFPNYFEFQISKKIFYGRNNGRVDDDDRKKINKMEDVVG
jgi:hypothetical protein